MKKLLVLFALLVMAAVPAHAEESATMIVLDGSGSMWGRIGKKTKITIAREKLGALLGQWGAEQPLGLMAYGHRREGDCTDIEVLVPPAAGSAPKIKGALAGLKPHGKTPLSEAVRQAAAAMDFEKRPASVILLSDGKETCDADPCAVGKALEKAGVNFTAHVIGFQVSDEDSAGLQCLAQATGGLYVGTDNAGQLATALDRAAARAQKAPGNIQIVVRAKADAYKGWPQMHLIVDGGVIARQAVKSEQWRDYRFITNLDPADAERLVVDYVNDLYEGKGRDRNLYIQQIRFGDRVLKPAQGTYDRTTKPDLPGQEGLFWAGRLVWELK